MHVHCCGMRNLILIIGLITGSVSNNNAIIGSVIAVFIVILLALVLIIIILWRNMGESVELLTM